MTQTCFTIHRAKLRLFALALLASGAACSDPEPTNPQKLAVVDDLVQEQLALYNQTDVFAIFGQRANLSSARQMTDSVARGTAVVAELQRTANESQAEAREFLADQNATFEPFWACNCILIKNATPTLIRTIRAIPGVARLTANAIMDSPDPLIVPAVASPTGLEWNIAHIRANAAWADFGATGQDIVVANIDTGVDFSHEALVAKYRGTLPDGSFDHNYNWRDPSGSCGATPCDTHGHGTHTMGTMVGDNGDPGENQIGVAPGAQWIAALGCAGSGCSMNDLLDAGQWILAPTDINGQNPRPELRPHVVNNSWAGGPGDPWYGQIVDAWVASGIFPAFAVSNAGPACGTAASPGDYVASYATGAFDSSGRIADLSSRGPSWFDGETKPNIAAPGVAVRSSVPGNGYAAYSGTSMASPHTAAVVALMWSAAPSIVRDVEETWAILDLSAINVPDEGCGGTEEDNDVWGEGMLDAYAAVDLSPRGPVGTLLGFVRDADTGLAIEGADVTADGDSDRRATTDVDGHYSMRMPVGSYLVSARAFGYEAGAEATVVVGADETVQWDIELQTAAFFSVYGFVHDDRGEPVEGARVLIEQTPIPATHTDENGFFLFDAVPTGQYTLLVSSAGHCHAPATVDLVVDGDELVDAILQQRFDAFGYHCAGAAPSYVEANEVLPLSGDDVVYTAPLPFPFPLYGETYDEVHICTNGYMNFLAPNCYYRNTMVPDPSAPNAAIYAFWDDLAVDRQATVRTEQLGEAPDRRFVVEWRNVPFLLDSGRRVDFEVILHENGHVLAQYRNIADDDREQGLSATLGLEDGQGIVAFSYSVNTPALPAGESAILYQLPPFAFAEGTIVDLNDGLPVIGASLHVLDGEGQLVRSAKTNDQGAYRMHLPLGAYSLVVEATHYESETADLVLDVDGGTVQMSFALRTARSEATPASLSFIVPVGDSKTQSVTLLNTGSADLAFSVLELGGQIQDATNIATPQLSPDIDAYAMSTRGAFLGRQIQHSVAEAGEVLASFVPTGVALPWGIGVTDHLWVGDPIMIENHEFTQAGDPTGRSHRASWAGAWQGDMAYDSRHQLVCQVNVGGDNGIHCWDADTGTVQQSLSGRFPWTQTSQRGLAYRAEDDTFYVGGWNDGTLYHIKGFSWDIPGDVLHSCIPADPAISGLAYNPTHNVIWAATNGPDDTLYQLNPETCDILDTLGHPNPGYNAGGLELDPMGNLWMVSMGSGMVYLVDSGLPVSGDIPWLIVEPAQGVVAPGEQAQLWVTVDATGLEPGAYTVDLIIEGNSGRQPRLRVPIQVVVPAYRQGVNVGDCDFRRADSDGAPTGGSREICVAYEDHEGQMWSADQRYEVGGWGYYDVGVTQRTQSPIADTLDEPLLQSQREDFYSYAFDGLPDGVYEIELLFAELVQSCRPGDRMFDVIVNGNLVLPALDIAYEAGTLVAYTSRSFVEVFQGYVDIRFVPRTEQSAVLNALRVTHRPDMM